MPSDARSNAPLRIAQDWFEVKYEEAVALRRIADARLIALRICETIEKAEFYEAYVLSSPLTVTSDE